MRSVVTLNLYELREHLVNHHFTEVMGNISKHNPANFNQLLTALYAWKAEGCNGLLICLAQATANFLVAACADEYALAAH